MALLMKKYDGNNKGVVVLTHKEANLLPMFDNYRKYYFFGCHIGCYHKEKQVGGFDFYMSSEQQLPSNFPEKDKIIELNSRNFLPNQYHNINGKTKESLIHSITEVQKVSKTKLTDETMNYIMETDRDYVWDILWINKPHQVKNIKWFLEQLKELFDREGPCRVLLVCAISPNERGPFKSHFLNPEKYISENFTKEEQKYISLLRPETDGNEGADNSLIPPFYQWSNTFSFYTEKEGESRVVHEALCCGCRIIYYEFVEGGSNDYLDDTNSISFTDFGESWKSLSSGIKMKKVEDCDDIHKKCLEKNGLITLKEELGNLYENNNELFDGKLEEMSNLHFELPAHNHTVSWKGSGMETGDLREDKVEVFITDSGMIDWWRNNGYE